MVEIKDREFIAKSWPYKTSAGASTSSFLFKMFNKNKLSSDTLSQN